MAIRPLASRRISQINGCKPEELEGTPRANVPKVYFWMGGIFG